MRDMIPEQAGHHARDKLEQSYGCAVPADTTCAERLRHEIRGEGLADGSEDALEETIEDEQRGRDRDCVRQREAKIGEKESEIGCEKDTPSAETV